jgi:hypothetical protein
MKLILPFVDPITRKKIVFNEPMASYVPSNQLRKSHGGELEFEYDHTIYWPALNKLAEERRTFQYERWVKGGKMVGEFETYLKGGTETSLKDTMRSSQELTEKVGDLQQNGEKQIKSVAISEESKDDTTTAISAA